MLNLWDCGGQDVFYEAYFASQREHTFRNVAVLIYVFDASSGEVASDLDYYASTIDALAQLSPDARVFVLLHKMDLIPEEIRDALFVERSDLIRSRSAGLSVELFRTSIWDETLYRAWSTVVHALIPRMEVLQSKLAEFAEVCEADEVVLFERATFLVISSCTRKEQADPHRCEKISNIVKQFKLSCMKAQAQFQGLRTGGAAFTVLVDAFTSNTYAMVVTSTAAPGAPPAPTAEATLLNLAIARERFERLMADI